MRQKPSSLAIKYSRRYIDFNRYGFQHHSGTNDSNFDTDHGLSVTRRIAEYRKSLELDKTYGCAPQDYLLYSTSYPSKTSLLSLLADRIIPELVVSPDRKSIPRLIYANAGFLRFDILKGGYPLRLWIMILTT